MNQPGRRSASKKSFSGNHQRSWLWGRHAVLETLQAERWPVLEIYTTSEAYEQSSELLRAPGQAGIPVQVVPAARLEQLCRSSEHQGLLIRLGAFPYASLEQLNERVRTAISSEGEQPPLVVICDRIQDNFNFGAILRCCDGVGAIGVVVGLQRQSEVTPHVVRASSGAANYMPIARASDLKHAVIHLKQLGLRIVAADPNVSHSVWSAPLDAPCALIIGSEAHGVDAELLAQCDQRVFIPMRGRVSSLNAAVAAGIVLYEIRRQQALH